MNLALNFLWVLGVEYTQNLPFIIGIVYAWAGFKRGMAWWKWLLILLIGNFSCAALIVSMDWIKLLPTTLTTGSQDVASVIRLGVIFSIGTGLMLLYFALTTRLKRPLWADAVFGVVLALPVALAETQGNFASFLVIMHALGLATAAASLITLFRHSADVAQGREMLIRIGFVTLLMSVLIVIFDYAPHLRR